MCQIEISCQNQQVKNWTVSHFESHSANAFELHTFVGKNSRSLVRMVPTEGIPLRKLKGSWLNGFFGSGLPKTMGIQLLVGSNLKAFRDPASAPIVIGKTCSLVSQEGGSISSEYLKGSRYGFLGYKVVAEDHTIEFVFGNWSYSPHRIRVKCHGDENEILEKNTAQIESDLNGAVQFYQK